MDEDWPLPPPELTGYDKLIWVVVEIRKRRPLTPVELAQIRETRAFVQAEHGRLTDLLTTMDGLLSDQPIGRA